LNPLQPDDSQRLDALASAFASLAQNQARLEVRLARLEKSLPVQAEAAATIETPVLREPTVVHREIIQAPIEPQPEVVRRETPDTPIEPEPAVAEIPADASTLESKVGLTVVNRIGAITLVLGVAFFFKWAVDNNWIGPAGRVALGLLAGFVTLAVGDAIWRKRQLVFAQGITATGIAILFLAIYAAFGFYHLIPQTAAFLMMVAATVMAALLALRYDSVAIAALGLVAGYATPLLLSTGEDHPWFLFSYLLLLNVAATELATRRKWRGLEIIGFIATVLIYGGWLFSRGTRPEDHLIATLAPLAFCAQLWRTQTPLLFAVAQFLTAAALALIWQREESRYIALALLVAAAGLVFAQLRDYRDALLSAFAGFWLCYALHVGEIHQPLTQFLGASCGFALFYAWSWWDLSSNTRKTGSVPSAPPESSPEFLPDWRRPAEPFALPVQRAAPSTVALSLFALNGVIYYAHSYWLLRSDYHLWLGPLAVLVAGGYLVFGLLLRRQTAESNADTRPVLLALGIAISFLTLAIPIQFTGFTITIAWAMQGAALTWIGCRLSSTRALLAALLVFGLVGLRLLVFEAESLPDPPSYALLWNTRFLTFAVSAVAMLLAAWWGSKILQLFALATYFGGHVSLLLGLCLEITGWAGRSVSAEDRLSAETIGISILFGVYAVALVSAGVATRTVINRVSGLGLTGIVIAKLYLFDVWQLSRPYQISAFVILGILLLATSFLYSHFRRLIESWWKDEKSSP
jgi:uncharacterized membrane protein